MESKLHMARFAEESALKSSASGAAMGSSFGVTVPEPGPPWGGKPDAETV